MGKIVIEVGDEVKVDYQGYKGDECFIAEERLKKALSSVMKANFSTVRLKSEYYQKSSEQEKYHEMG